MAYSLITLGTIMNKPRNKNILTTLPEEKTPILIRVYFER